MTYYEYIQNNPGGRYITNDCIGHTTYIAADSPEQADAKALEIGIYFEGVAAGLDCPCCGDRWRRADACVGYVMPLPGRTVVVYHRGGRKEVLA